MSTIIQEYSYTVPAGGQIPIFTTGYEVSCFKATGPFRLRVEPYGEMPMEQQVKFRAPSNPFTKLTIVNQDLVNDIDVVLLISNGMVDDGRVSISLGNSLPVNVQSMPNAPVITTIGQVVVAAEGTTAVASANQDRRQLIIKNIGAIEVQLNGFWLLEPGEILDMIFRDAITAETLVASVGKLQIMEG